MPKDKTINKVLVIGSGPIVIGQAAEFDYAGTQACRALKAEGLYVILANSNPATIMTDKEMADKIYIEPLTIPVLKNIINKEKPDSILPTLGGQTGLNLAMELEESGYLEKMGVKLLGTTVETIKKAEDRETFKETMIRINEPIIDSVIVNSVDKALEFGEQVGYPLIVRPAYTLGGTGGGFANNAEELSQITTNGLDASRVHQCLIERSVAGWKEIEYEVIRDNIGNCITVCSMENVDPVGVHTGDSIVVAPAQTLTDREHQMLRSAAIKIVHELGVSGGCNVQIALSVDSTDYALIEVNPRVSRSSALASKATGYPIAKVAALIAIGYNLDEIPNMVTGKTCAAHEPAIDYIVTKFPRWPFDKFTQADKRLGTKMKATGEIMSIGENFEQSFMKAVRSLEVGKFKLQDDKLAEISTKDLKKSLMPPDDNRIFRVCELLRRGDYIDEIYESTKIDKLFLRGFKKIVDLESKLVKEKTIDKDTMRKAKKYGFADVAIAKFINKDTMAIRNMRKKWGIIPVFNMVDTCAGEFEAVSPYYYSTYRTESEHPKKPSNTILVLGSGPIRIGQGIEFDYCSVHCINALKKKGYDAVIVNNNPETVSTDFDISDRLYFEPLTPEDVFNVLDAEQPVGVIVQFGGQTAIKLAQSIIDYGYKLIGTKIEDIDAAEDRELFDNLLEKIGVSRPQGVTVYTMYEALKGAEKLGFPVLVRPSYVLGGQGMEICYDVADLEMYMSLINLDEQEHPILIDKYIIGKELEVDAICDGKDILIPGIMEHIERTGIHSGDSIAVYPSLNVTPQDEANILKTTKEIALGLNTIGLINIQYILRGQDLYVIEVNPRSSRTVPYISKVTGVPMVELATRCSLGENLIDLGYGVGLYRKAGVYAVKVPVFSNEKITGLDFSLSPEMKSTGEVLGVSEDIGEALLKGLYASNMKISFKGGVFLSISEKFKWEILPIAVAFKKLGFTLYATEGTASYLERYMVEGVIPVKRDIDAYQNVKQLIDQKKVQYIINTPTKGRNSKRFGFKLRRLAVDNGVPCLTSVDTANALIRALHMTKSDSDLSILALDDYGGK